MEEPQATLPTQIAIITERWRESCGKSLVNFVFQERGKSYLSLLCATSGERISSTHEAHRPSPTRSAISTTPDRGSTAAQRAHFRRPIASQDPQSFGNGLAFGNA